MNFEKLKERLRDSTLSKAMRTCTTIIVLLLALSSANADALLRQITVRDK